MVLKKRKRKEESVGNYIGIWIMDRLSLWPIVTD